MVHMSDIAWGISGEEALHLHRKGETVQVVVLDVDVEKERISLGIKQLEKGAPAVGAGAGSGSLKKNETVTVTVLDVSDNGLEVKASDDGATGYHQPADLRPACAEKTPERSPAGLQLAAMVTEVAPQQDRHQ